MRWVAEIVYRLWWVAEIVYELWWVAEMVCGLWWWLYCGGCVVGCGGSYVVVVVMVVLWWWLCCGFEWLVDMGLSGHWRVMMVSGCGFKWLVE